MAIFDLIEIFFFYNPFFSYHPLLMTPNLSKVALRCHHCAVIPDYQMNWYFFFVFVMHVVVKYATRQGEGKLNSNQFKSAWKLTLCHILSMAEGLAKYVLYAAWSEATSKNYRFLRHYILGTYNPNLIELILKPVLMYLNVFSYWRYL